MLAPIVGHIPFVALIARRLGVRDECRDEQHQRSNALGDLPRTIDS
jgi:hypothetical protein